MVLLSQIEKRFTIKYKAHSWKPCRGRKTMKILSIIISAGILITSSYATQPQWSEKPLVGARAASLPSAPIHAWHSSSQLQEEQKQGDRALPPYRTVTLSSDPSAPFLYPQLPPPSYPHNPHFTAASTARSESLSNQYHEEEDSSEFHDVPLRTTESIHGQQPDEMIRLGRENLDKALEAFTQCFSAIKNDFERAAQAYIEQSNVQLDTSIHHEEKKRSLFATVAYKSRVLLKGKEEAEIHEQKNALKKQIKSNSLLKEEAQRALAPLIVRIGAITNGVSKIQEAVTKGKEETSQKQADIRERRMSQNQSPATPIQHRKSSYNLSQTPPSPHTMRSEQFK